MAPRLTEQEIDRALAKIRAEYDHLIVHYFKSRDAKDKFDERLAETLRARVDMTGFLGVEMQVVKTLLMKAAHKAENPVHPTEAAPVKAGPKLSYADRVLAQLRARIANYPSLGLPDNPQLSLDVDKLYGTLRWFRKEVWEFLYPVIVKKSPSPLLYRIEDELVALTLDGDVWPKEVDSYVQMLMGNASLSQLSRAQNRCLLQAAQFLHRLRALFDGMVAETTFDDREKTSLERAVAFCDRVMLDFRLRDLKPHR